MLQIIGWLGCVYLFVRCASMMVSNEFKNAEGQMDVAASVIATFGLIASLGFAIWLNGQGLSFETANDLERLTSEANQAEIMADCMEEAVDAGRSPLEC